MDAKKIVISCYEFKMTISFSRIQNAVATSFLQISTNSFTCNSLTKLYLYELQHVMSQIACTVCCTEQRLVKFRKVFSSFNWRWNLRFCLNA